MEKIWFCSDKSGHRTALKLNDEADGLQVGVMPVFGFVL